MIALIAALLPVVAIVATLAGPGRSRPTTLLIATATLQAILASLALSVTDAGPRAQLAGGLFTDDPMSRVFLALLSIVFFGITLYVGHRVAVEPVLAPSMVRYARLSLAFIAAANLSVLSNHLVLAWVFLEGQTIFATPLIHHLRGAGSHRAAWRYLVFSTVGLALTFLGFACLAKGLSAGGHEVSFLVDELRVEHAAPFWRRLGLLLILFGYGTKIGLVPMYAWLPETYEASPPSVTALLAAVQTTSVFYSMFRVMQVYRAADPGLVSYELVGMGLATLLMSTVLVVGATNFKKLIASAAMAHNAILAVGLGIGKEAAYGVVLYMFTNALVKALLFITCGNIKARYRTKSIPHLRGLITDMPVSGLMFMVGIFALLGFAPFGSFLGEVMILGGLMKQGQLAVFTLFCVLLTVLLVSIGRSIFPMIWGQAKVKFAKHGGSETLASLAPNLIFVALLFALGMSQPGPMNSLFQQVAANVEGK